MGTNCNFSDEDYHALKRHTNKEHQMFTWSCRSCPAVFGDRKVRKHHWDTIHKIESNQTCEFCGRTFDTEAQLNRHVQIHDQKYHVTCQNCGKVFTSKGNLK